MEPEDNDWSDWEGLNDGKELPKDGHTNTATETMDEACLQPLFNNGDTEPNLADDLSKLQKYNTSRGLGEEFDIMAIKVVPNSSEMNLFDGMQPVIATFKPLYVQLNQSMDVISPDTAKVRYSFEVAESNVSKNVLES